MNRIILNQYLINKYQFSAYLEIGTFKGESFLPVKCRNKIAVDPAFQIPQKERLRWMWENPLNIRNKYFQMTSDEFFKSHKKLLKKGIDLVFIDGLHTFEASLKDTLNSLKYLNSDGYIVLHDCLPPHRAAETRAESYEEAQRMKVSDWTGEWCGDVWKTILYLRRGFPEQLNVCTLDCDYGLGVVQILNSDLNLYIDKELFDEIMELEYDDLKENVFEYLNLKKEDYLLKQ